MTVRLVAEGGPHAGVSRVDVSRRARAMLAALQMQKAELSVVLTTDNQIAKLNAIYRKKTRPTDVLAFAQREGEPGGRAELLGDVIISVETARRQAAGRGWDLLSEITMLLAHGLLHLLGWDHATPAEDRRMRAETERLCEAARGGAARSESRKTRSVRAPAAVPRRVKVKTGHKGNGDSGRRRARTSSR
jgi:probable rRNA maturation factor